jgi:hypothetical protein
MEVSGQLYIPTTLTTEKERPYNWTEDWAGCGGEE